MSKRSGLLLAGLLFVVLCGSATRAMAASGTVAVIPPTQAQACAGALAEAVAELRAARFLAEVVPEASHTPLGPFDAALRFASLGDRIVLIDLSDANAPIELATLRLDCQERLARRRVWTIVVELLWARPSAGGTDVDSANQRTGAETPATTPPSPLLTPKSELPAGKRRDTTAAAMFFGAGPVLGVNAFVLGPAWDLAMIGGYRFASGFRVAARLRWPISVAQQPSNDEKLLRLWTFSADVETSRVFARPQAFVKPFVGTSLGLNFTLVDVGAGAAAQDRRWDGLHAHALAHAGLMFAASTYAPFFQLEAGVGRRLTSEANLDSIEGDRNTFMTAASIGVLFDY